MTETLIGNSWEQVDSFLKSAWVARHDPVGQRELEAYLANAAETLKDALTPALNFFELTLGTDHESIFALAGELLYAIRLDDERMCVDFLGTFPGGSYTEEKRIEEGHLAGTSLTYKHNDLPGGELSYTFSNSVQDVEKYEPLRKVLREWARAPVSP
jgi:hypothetical protein